MPIKLTWDDLLIEDPSLDHQALLQDWTWLVTGPYRPIAGTKFGDWFIERESGSVEMLDAMEGTLQQIASSRSEFQHLVNTQERQEQWLLSLLVFTLHEQGVIPGPGECYAFRIPPVLGGKAESGNVEVMSLRVWMSISGQLHRQLQSRPPGSRITGFRVIE